MKREQSLGRHASGALPSPGAETATIEEMCASPDDTIGFIPAMGYALANSLCGVEPGLGDAGGKCEEDKADVPRTAQTGAETERLAGAIQVGFGTSALQLSSGIEYRFDDAEQPATGSTWYDEVMSRVDFKDPVNSLILTKPSNNHHYGGLRGGFEVDIAWKDGQLTQATIRSLLGNPLKLRYESKTLTKTLDKGDSFTWDGQ